MGGVKYFDGEETHQVATGLMFPNGINMSSDGRFVYVSVSMEKALRVYVRRDNNSLLLYKVIPLYTVPDNIDVDPATGTLHIGCHPVPWQLMYHMEYPLLYFSPSQVLEVKMKDGDMIGYMELFAEEGYGISGSSVAIFRQGQLLIGSVMHKMLRCEINIWNKNGIFLVGRASCK